MDKYQKLDKLGEGTYGAVFKGIDANIMGAFAMPIFSRCCVIPLSRVHIFCSLVLLSVIHHHFPL
jgi:hypothetical protein